MLFLVLGPTFRKGWEHGWFMGKDLKNREVAPNQKIENFLVVIKTFHAKRKAFLFCPFFLAGSTWAVLGETSSSVLLGYSWCFRIKSGLLHAKHILSTFNYHFCPYEALKEARIIHVHLSDKH